MSINYSVLEYTVNSLVEQLMIRYNSSFDSSLNVVLCSDLYKRLQNNASFLEEGDIYLFSKLEEELIAKGIVSMRSGDVGSGFGEVVSDGNTVG